MLHGGFEVETMTQYDKNDGNSLANIQPIDSLLNHVSTPITQATTRHYRRLADEPRTPFTEERVTSMHSNSGDV